MKDCINCKNKNWLRVINKPVMECFVTKQKFEVVTSQKVALDCPHYEANNEKL